LKASLKKQIKKERKKERKKEAKHVSCLYKTRGIYTVALHDHIDG
jgi:hypothetical protein